MPFRPTFDCLWCGRAWKATGEGDLTGWATLCPDCLDRAQDNGFLRYRVRTALRERSARGTASSTEGPRTPSRALPLAVATAPAEPPRPQRGVPPLPADGDLDAETRAYLTAHALETDDWYLRRGRYARGPARDLAWHAELDTVTTWLDGQPISGELVELAAGTGWWSPLLAGKGVLSLYDTSEAALDRARERLMAHRLRAHLHERDPWAEPDRQVDAVFCASLLRRVTDERLDDFLALVGRWLRPGGRFAFIDALPDPEVGAVDETPAVGGVARRRLADGRQLRVVEVPRSPEALDAALERAGFRDRVVTRTPRFFVMGTAVRPD